MNPTMELIYKRKSVRVYEEKEVPPEVKRAILSAAIQAPSASNMNLYTIIDVTDPALKQRLSVTCDNQPFIAKAPVVLVFCADYYRWYRSFCAHMETVRAPEEGDLFLANCDALIAAQNAVIAAESFGLGSCYIGDILENFEEHQKLLNLPDHVAPACMVCMGYPTPQQRERAKPPRFAVEDVVHENGYSLEKADRMDEMLMNRGGCADNYADWLQKFCARKWNSEFSVEMSRSCREILKYWCKKG